MPVPENALSSYHLPTPGRAYHLRWIGRREYQALAVDADMMPQYPDDNGLDPTSGVPSPSLDYSQPNDRGCLVGVATSRLPLDRHLCAETLWSFFRFPHRPGGNCGSFTSWVQAFTARHEGAMVK